MKTDVINRRRHPQSLMSSFPKCLMISISQYLYNASSGSLLYFTLILAVKVLIMFKMETLSVGKQTNCLVVQERNATFVTELEFVLMATNDGPTNRELDIIASIRGEVTARKEITGENLFLAWGYPTAVVLMLELS